MAGRSYSVVQKLAGAALARLRGEEHAASELKVDRATVRRWLKAAPEDGWALARDLAQARLQEQLATGKVNASQLATVAGIAERNVRYGELLRQREQRKQGEATAGPELSPIAEAAAQLPEERVRYVTRALRFSEHHDANPEAAELSEQEFERQFLAWLGTVGAWTDEEFVQAQAELQVEIEAAGPKPQSADGSPDAAPEPPPRPTETAQAAPEAPARSESPPMPQGAAVISFPLDPDATDWHPFHREPW